MLYPSELKAQKVKDTLSLVPKLKLGNADGCSSTQQQYNYFLLISICCYMVIMRAVCIPKLELGNEGKVTSKQWWCALQDSNL